MARAGRVRGLLLHPTALVDGLVITRLLLDPDVGIQEQAWTIARNLAEDEQGIELIVGSLGIHALMNSLVIVLSSSHDDVLEQVLVPKFALCYMNTDSTCRPPVSSLI